MNMLSTTSSPLYALQDVPGKGKGRVAIQDNAKGTRILSKEAIITIPENAEENEQLQTSICRFLNKDQRRAFLCMNNINQYETPAEQYLGIVWTNGLPTGSDGMGGGILLEGCRINHTCDNKAQKNWNEKLSNTRSML